MTAVHRTAPVCCPVCNKTVERRSRQQRYCSSQCMRRANYARKAGSGELWGHDGARVRNPHKSESKNNSLQRPKTGSSISCDGPINILGGCSFRWSGAVRLDSKTLARIIWSEIGGEVVAPDEVGR
jgi:hypothetical protein